jgi:hypothetical protein
MANGAACRFLPDKDGSVIIPDSFQVIPQGFFHNCTSLVSVTIPDTVQSIGASAFGDCANLESVVLPDSVTTIATEAFAQCPRLKSIIIPDSITSIAGETFAFCKGLTSVVLSNRVTAIHNYAFYATGLTFVTIPDSVVSISGDAFGECLNLTSVTIPDTAIQIDSNAFRFNPCNITFTAGAMVRNCTAFTTTASPTTPTVAPTASPTGPTPVGCSCDLLTTQCRNVTTGLPHSSMPYTCACRKGYSNIPNNSLACRADPEHVGSFVSNGVFGGVIACLMVLVGMGLLWWRRTIKRRWGAAMLVATGAVDFEAVNTRLYAKFGVGTRLDVGPNEIGLALSVTGLPAATLSAGMTHTLQRGVIECLVRATAQTRLLPAEAVQWSTAIVRVVPPADLTVIAKRGSKSQSEMGISTVDTILDRVRRAVARGDIAVRYGSDGPRAPPHAIEQTIEADLTASGVL